MKPPLICMAFVVVYALLGKDTVPAQAGGEEKQSSSVIKGLKAPARPDAPWPAPDLRAFSEPLREEHPPELEADKEYELAELIDVAERSNPATKVAWARAKEAASGVGLAKSEYYPVLALKASAMWANLSVPIPIPPNKVGYLSVEGQVADAVAEL